MAVPKVLGTETEFGITVLNQADFNPVLASSAVINSYAGARSRIKWSFDEESPGRDARGFGLFDAPVDRVNVKGKTGERIGAVGRGEAVRATAVVLLID